MGGFLLIGFKLITKREDNKLIRTYARALWLRENLFLLKILIIFRVQSASINGIQTEDHHKQTIETKTTIISIWKWNLQMHPSNSKNIYSIHKMCSIKRGKRLSFWICSINLCLSFWKYLSFFWCFLLHLPSSSLMMGTVPPMQTVECSYIATEVFNLKMKSAILVKQPEIKQKSCVYQRSIISNKCLEISNANRIQSILISDQQNRSMR